MGSSGVLADAASSKRPSENDRLKKTPGEPPEATSSQRPTHNDRLQTTGSRRTARLALAPFLFALRVRSSANYLCLQMSVLVSFLTTLFPTDLVIKAVMTTAIAVASITGYTATSSPKRDLTEMGTFLYTTSAAFAFYQLLLLLNLTGWLPFRVPWSEMLGCSFGAGLAATYIAFHTRMIFAKPDQKYKFAKDDHVIAALLLYNDIIRLFVYILRILAESKREK